MRRARLAIACAIVTCGRIAGAQPAPSIDDFAAYSDFGAVTLSPDGNRVAYTANVAGKRALKVLDLEKRTETAILEAEKDHFQITWCRFKAAQRLLCGFRGIEFFGSDPVPVTRLIAIDADGRRLTTLVQDSRNASARFQDRILDWQPHDPKHVLIELSARGKFSSFREVYRLDVDGGLLTRQVKERYPITAWYTDSAGVVRYGSGCDVRKRCEYVARDTADADWRVLRRWEAFAGRDGFNVLGFGPDGRKLLVSEVDQDRFVVYQLDLAGEAERELVFDHPQVDVGGVVEWPGSGAAVGFWYETDRYRREIFDGAVAGAFALVDKSLPDTVNHVVATARNDRLLLVAAHSDVLPPRYHLLDLDDKSLRALDAIAPALARTPLAPMQPVKIRAADGATLPGYLTVPRGADPKNLPLVVFPHGGPHARDSWGFDEVVQFLASRGYAVLQVNFRGSTGYGRRWYESGLRKWGTVMVDDVNAATRWAVAQGIADPQRTCIVGWDFGGYVALMGAIREPQLYRCIASIAGVSDLRALKMQERDYYGREDAVDYFVGSDADELAAGSPRKASAALRAPVLLVHGTLDTQVDVEQSRAMNRELGQRGKVHQFLAIEDGDHRLTRAAWRKALYGKLEAFLAGSNPTRDNPIANSAPAP